MLDDQRIKHATHSSVLVRRKIMIQLLITLQQGNEKKRVITVNTKIFKLFFKGKKKQWKKKNNGRRNEEKSKTFTLQERNVLQLVIEHSKTLQITVFNTPMQYLFN